MKLWVTRSTEMAIGLRGLDALQVWFKKPIFMQGFFQEAPFGPDGPYDGYRNYGWELRQGKFQTPIPAGVLFGYTDRKNQESNDISLYIWNELEKHFLNAPIEEWENLEKTNKVDMKLFILEIEVDIHLSK